MSEEEMKACFHFDRAINYINGKAISIISRPSTKFILVVGGYSLMRSPGPSKLKKILL